MRRAKDASRLALSWIVILFFENGTQSLVIVFILGVLNHTLLAIGRHKFYTLTLIKVLRLVSRAISIV